MPLCQVSVAFRSRAASKSSFGHGAAEARFTFTKLRSPGQEIGFMVYGFHNVQVSGSVMKHAGKRTQSLEFMS